MKKMENSKKYGFLTIEMIGILLIGAASILFKGYFLGLFQGIGFCFLIYGICKGIKDRMDAYKKTANE